MNLVVNARDAIASRGRIVIATGTTELDAAYVSRHPGSLSGQYVLLTVSDTGCGMEENIKTRIFEPFFTTKEVGQGTGLGLSTVYGIVKQCGGYIWVYSEPGQGTTFKIYFPKILEKAEALTLHQEEVPQPRGTELVLLVEDDESFRELTVTVLENAGYRVVEAKDAEAALQILTNPKVEIDLLLSDVIMPGESGMELLSRAKAICPNLRSLFMSGYSGDLISQRGHLLPESAFLEKPFTRKSLLTKVHAILHPRP